MVYKVKSVPFLCKKGVASGVVIKQYASKNNFFFYLLSHLSIIGSKRQLLDDIWVIVIKRKLKLCCLERWVTASNLYLFSGYETDTCGSYLNVLSGRVKRL